MNNTNAIALSGIFAVFTVIAALISTLVPWLGIPMLAVLPISSAVLCIRTDFRWAALSGVVALVLVSILTDPITALFFSPQIVMGILIGVGLSREWPAFSCAIAGAGASLFTLVALFALTALLGDFSYAALRPMVLELVDELLSSGQFASALEADVSLRANIREYVESMLVLLPSAIISSQIVIGFVSLYFTVGVTRRVGIATKIPPFRDLIFPRTVSTSIAVMMLVTMALAQFNLVSFELASNLQLIFLSPFLVAGCAVVTGVLIKRLPPAFIFLLLGLAVVLLAYPLMLLGIIDTLFDFRKVRSRYGQ